MATCTLLGCIAVVVDADQQGRAPLKGQFAASKYQHRPKQHHNDDNDDEDGTSSSPASLNTTTSTTPSSLISKEQCRQLEDRGYLIVDNFLTFQQCQDARAVIRELDANQQFLGSPIERESNHNASSYVHNENRVLQYRANQGALANVRWELARFAKDVSESDFRGFTLPSPSSSEKEEPSSSVGDAAAEVVQDDYESSRLHVPAQMQVSICGGTPGGKSSHDFFKIHLDTAGADRWEELGWLGWLKSQHLRRRYLTCIVYLTDHSGDDGSAHTSTDWKPEYGGCLRLFARSHQDYRVLPDATDYIDVPPLQGRLVVFSSLTQFHGVQPNQGVARYACAVWLTLTESS